MMLVTASCTSCWSELLKSPGLSLASSSFSGRTLTTAVPRRKASSATEKSSPSAKGVAQTRSTFFPPNKLQPALEVQLLRRHDGRERLERGQGLQPRDQVAVEPRVVGAASAAAAGRSTRARRRCVQGRVDGAALGVAALGAGHKLPPRGTASEIHDGTAEQRVARTPASRSVWLAALRAASGGVGVRPLRGRAAAARDVGNTTVAAGRVADEEQHGGRVGARAAGNPAGAWRAAGATGLSAGRRLAVEPRFSPRARATLARFESETP